MIKTIDYRKGFINGLKQARDMAGKVAVFVDGKKCDSDTENTHPLCPDCGRRLVFVALCGGGKMFRTWQCDCQYRQGDDDIIPPEIVGDIMRCREWDDGSATYDMEIGLFGGVDA